jgi:hypothetical protein
MSASVTRPKIAHAVLVDIPRQRGGYQRGAAIRTMVKRVMTHATPQLMEGSSRQWQLYNELCPSKGQKVSLPCSSTCSTDPALTHN